LIATPESNCLRLNEAKNCHVTDVSEFLLGDCSNDLVSEQAMTQRPSFYAFPCGIIFFALFFSSLLFLFEVFS